MTHLKTDPIGEPGNEGWDRAFKASCQRRKLDEPELRRYMEGQARAAVSLRNRRKKK